MIDEIRRDEAIRSGPLKVAILAFVACSFYWPTETPAEFWKLCWPASAVFLFFAHVGRRASVLDLGLPLSAQRLWLTHSLTLGLGAIAFLALSTGLGVLVGPIDGLPLAAAQIYDQFLRLGAGLVIVVVLLQSRKPALARLTPRLAEILVPAALLFTIPIVLVLDVAWLIALLGLALGLALHTWRSLPPTLTLEPVAAAGPAVDAPGPEPRPAAAPIPGASWQRALRGLGPATRSHARPLGAGRWHAADPYRFAVSGTVVVVLLGILFLFGILLSEPMDADTWSADYRFLWGLVVLCLSMLWFEAALHQLPTLDPLPVSRRVLFAAMTLRPMAAVVLGFGIGAVFKGSLDGISAIFVLLLGALWLGLDALFLGALHALSRRVPGVWLAAAVLPLAIATQRGWIGSSIGLNALPDMAEACLRQSVGGLPGGTAALVLLAGLLLGAAYALAEARFRRLEVPPQRREPETLGGV